MNRSLSILLMFVLGLPALLARDVGAAPAGIQFVEAPCCQTVCVSSDSSSEAPQLSEACCCVPSPIDTDSSGHDMVLSGEHEWSLAPMLVRPQFSPLQWPVPTLSTPLWASRAPPGGQSLLAQNTLLLV